MIMIMKIVIITKISIYIYVLYSSFQVIQLHSSCHMKTESLIVEVGDFPKQQGTASTPRRCRMLSDMPHLKKASYRCIRLQDVDSPAHPLPKREKWCKERFWGEGMFQKTVCGGCFVFFVHFLGGLWEGSLSLKHANTFGTSPNNPAGNLPTFATFQPLGGLFLAATNQWRFDCRVQQTCQQSSAAVGVGMPRFFV